MPNNFTNVMIAYAPYYDEGYTYPEQFSKDGEFDVDAFNAKYSKANLCDLVRPMPDEVKNTTVGSHGHDPEDDRGWHGWAIRNWGTKWGTYNTRAHELGGDFNPVVVEFQTAWSSPKPEVLEMIKEHFGSLGFKGMIFLGCDPCDESVKVLR